MGAGRQESGKPGEPQYGSCDAIHTGGQQAFPEKGIAKATFTFQMFTSHVTDSVKKDE